MKKYKTVLWILGIVLSILIIYIVVFIYLSFKSLQPDCERIESISIENYKINKSLCEAWIGPRFVNYSIYENGKIINGYKHDLDSCRFDYLSYNHILYKIDFCKKIIRKELHKKSLIKMGNVDSIYLKRLSTNDSIKLNFNQIDNWIKEWNVAPLDTGDCYSTNEEILYNKPEFQFKVFSENETRTFNTERFKIKEEKVNWIYTFLKEGEDRKTGQVFQNFWNEAQK
ncbi:MAG TPA: hypothetical protein VKY36_04610 [Moheibacter sp.]|nr:hypothetical protein [Moheibacter sp.]